MNCKHSSNHLISTVNTHARLILYERKFSSSLYGLYCRHMSPPVVHRWKNINRHVRTMESHEYAGLYGRWGGACRPPPPRTHALTHTHVVTHAYNNIITTGTRCFTPHCKWKDNDAEFRGVCCSLSVDMSRREVIMGWLYLYT